MTLTCSSYVLPWLLSVNLYPSLVRQQISMIGKESAFEMTGNIKLSLTEIAPLLFSLTLLFWSKAVEDPFYGEREKGALGVLI